MEWRFFVCLLCGIAVATALIASSATDLACRRIPNACVAVVVAARAAALVGERDPAGAAVRGIAGAATVAMLLAASDLAVQARRARRAVPAGAEGPASQDAPRTCDAPCTRDTGIGAGDVKLLCALALWLGPYAGLLLAGLSCVLALAGRGARILAGRIVAARRGFAAHPEAPGMPMAPAIAASFALLWGFGLA